MKPDAVIALDADPQAAQILKRRFAADARVSVACEEAWDLRDPAEVVFCLTALIQQTSLAMLHHRLEVMRRGSPGRRHRSYSR